MYSGALRLCTATSTHMTVNNRHVLKCDSGSEGLYNVTHGSEVFYNVTQGAKNQPGGCKLLLRWLLSGNTWFPLALPFAS